MSAEGTGIILGFATLFLDIIGLFISHVHIAKVSGKESGTMQEKGDNIIKVVDRLGTENSNGHEKIYDCQKETDMKVGQIEQHLVSINGHVKDHGRRIEDIEKQNCG